MSNDSKQDQPSGNVATETLEEWVETVRDSGKEWEETIGNTLGEWMGLK